jgi:phospholipid transport system substrate-binding protein
MRRSTKNRLPFALSMRSQGMNTKRTTMLSTLRRLVRTLFLLLIAFSAQLALAQEAPDALVKRVSEDVLGTIRSDKDLQAGNQAKVKQLIETKLVPNFDFNHMTALAVGRNWRTATPEQQKQLADEFRTLLVRTYSGALTAYRDNTMDYKPLRMNPADTETIVRTEVRRAGQAPVQIDYSMAKTADGWKAYDIVVAGVSLVTNYRDEFNDIVKSSGIDGLIKTLEAKNKGPAAPAK